MSTNNRRTLYLVFIFILLLTNIVAGYYWWNDNKSLNEEIDEITVEKNELESEYIKVQEDLAEQVAALQEMKGKNAELDSIIAIREKEITAQQAKISELFKQKNFSSSELKKAKDMIATLEKQNATYMQKIDSLNVYADEILTEKQGLETDLSTEKEKTASLEDKNKFLGSKVEVGSLLRADELSIVGIFEKTNGVEKDINKITKVKKMKVCYQTGKNQVRDPGKVTMYLRIITPSGTTLYNEANGSGTLTSKDGESIRYTKKGDFDYDGNNKSICIYWSQSFTETGKYKAMIYQDGYLVGESAIEFK